MSGGRDRVIAMIPARGGSKSIPDKNLVSLGGKPLLAWSIDIAKATPAIDRVIVSTDDPKIAAAAEKRSAEVYRRPDRLATDDALVIDAVRDVIGRLREEGETAQIMVLLEPTCPFRAVEDIEACIDEVRAGRDSAATFTAADVNPHRTWRLTGEGPEPFVKGAVPWRPRQELEDAYQLNGAVYAFRLDALSPDDVGLLVGRTAAVVMPAERSVDIDEPLDLAVARSQLREREQEGEPIE